MVFNAHPGDILHGAPLILLVDNGTASAAASSLLRSSRRAMKRSKSLTPVKSR